jgi:hypothetical protein
MAGWLLKKDADGTKRLARTLAPPYQIQACFQNRYFGLAMESRQTGIFKDREAQAPATEKPVSPAPPGLKWFYQLTHGFTVGYCRTLLRS